MADIHENILDLIGNTPLVRLNKINKGYADVVVKLEYFNPGNSVKDRPALYMIEKAEKDTYSASVLPVFSMTGREK